MALLLNRNSREKRGTALIETALVLPLLVLLLFGTMEYGWLFFRMHQLSATARDAVRVAIRPDTTDLGVTQRVSDLMEQSNFASGYTLSIDPPDVDTLNAGQVIQVSIEVSYSTAGLFNLPILPLPETLQGTATMAKEGPYGS